MPGDRPSILFYVLHLLGVGHIHRAKRLIEGFVKQDLEVDVIYGGVPVDLDLNTRTITHLPPIRARDASYKVYLDETGDELSQAYLERRKQSLLAAYQELSPDLILMEAWPFGRRMVRDELEALLAAARQRKNPPLIVTSVRDILQEKRKAGRAEETRDIVSGQIDHVLVHSDPNIARLDDTFPLADAFADKISYTGYVIDQPGKKPATEQFDVIVSVGGGGFGYDLAKTAAQLAASGYRSDWSWCIAHGPHMKTGDVQELRKLAPPNVTVVKRLDGLAQHLGRARLSISQCGYNTAMDALAARMQGECALVFVPYDISGQTEQPRRSELLARAGIAQNLPQSRLSVESLQLASEVALAMKLSKLQIDFDGVARSAKLVKSWIEGHRTS